MRSTENAAHEESIFIRWRCFVSANVLSMYVCFAKTSLILFVSFAIKGSTALENVPTVGLKCPESGVLFKS